VETLGETTALEAVGEPEFETELDPEFSVPEVETVDEFSDALPTDEGGLQGEGYAAGAALGAAGIASFLTDEETTQDEPLSDTLADEYLADETQLEGILPPEILGGENAQKIVPSGSGKAASHEPVEIKMRKRLEFIEGIGPVYAAKLLDAEVETTGKLLVEGLSRKGRKALAERSGIPERLILEWVNHVDLYRVKGVGSEYADLLEAAGVDTIPELAQRRPDHLYQALELVNTQRHLVRQLPTEANVADWIEQAGQLPRIIQY
jgi:predicted flap endonuclease-1-like 5' DNA nuclease